MMRKALVVVAAALALALTACAVQPAVQSPVAGTRTASATPTPTPTVRTLSIDDAGKFYLAAVCPANTALAANNAAFAAQDLARVKQTAAAARDAYRQSAAAFTSTDVIWPSEVSAADLKLIADADFAIIALYDSIASAESLEAATASSSTYVDNGAGAAAQRIRLALNLAADTSAGC